MPIPFPQNGGHILGQPFTISNVAIPINATLTCNCTQPPAEMQVVSSAPVTCHECQKTYLVALNPSNGQIVVGIAAAQEQVQ